MSTRCMIAKRTKGGYKAVYSHWDGYPTKPGVGWTLRTFYKNPTKIDALLSKGDISSLRENIGRKHSFDKASRAGAYSDKIRKMGWTTFYGRDRGERGTSARTFKTLSDLRKYARNSWAEYLYVYEKGKWTTYRL